MSKVSIILLCVVIVGCGGAKPEEIAIKYMSPFRDLPVEDVMPEIETREIDLNPILKDSIITLEEQEFLLKVLSDLLDELAKYKKLYYMQLLKK